MLEYVKKHTGTSFGEIYREFPEARGDYEIGLIEYNIIFWIGLSKEAVDIINRWKDNKIVKATPCGLIIYAIDGEMLTIPTAKQLRKYKNKRWLPVTLDYIEQ